MATTDPPLSSLTLRAIADYASGLREPQGERPWYLLVEGPGTPEESITAHREPPVAPEGAVVIVCATAEVNPDRPKVVEVGIRAQDMAVAEQLQGRYDAVFWSEASVEKFVFPYYAGKAEWLAGNWLSHLSNAFYYGHPTPRGAGLGTEGDDDPSVPFAIAHVPRSEYSVLDEPGHELALLVRKKGGTVEHQRFSEILKQRLREG